MKKCPFCAEEIQDEAIKCRYCQEMLGSKLLVPSQGPPVNQVTRTDLGLESTRVNPFLVGVVLAILSALFVPVQFLGFKQHVFFATMFQADQGCLRAGDFIDWGAYLMQVGGAFVVGLILGYLSFLTAQQPPTTTSSALGGGEIGVSLKSEGGQIVVSSVQPDSPAGKGGIQVGDIIVCLNNETLDQAINLLRGEVGSKVVVTISHNGENREVSLTRTLLATPWWR